MKREANHNTTTAATKHPTSAIRNLDSPLGLLGALNFAGLLFWLAIFLNIIFLFRTQGR